MVALHVFLTVRKCGLHTQLKNCKLNKLQYAQPVY